MGSAGNDSGVCASIYERLGYRLNGNESAGVSDWKVPHEKLPTPEEAFEAADEFLGRMFYLAGRASFEEAPLAGF
ncbi:hypothetical protein HZB07_02775 [Candidatus Saganbacteria bacterium]|nr:hypothetical protein [Candidatus Saganbacteria bacterium]